MANENEQKAPENPQPAPHGDECGETDWKAEARKWEARAKENKGSSDELKKLKEAQMTELEKAKAEAEEAKAEAARLKGEKEREFWINEAAKESGVPSDILRGSTKEEIEAHAESLKPHFTKPTAPTLELGKPSSNEPTSEKEEFARKLFGRE